MTLGRGLASGLVAACLFGSSVAAATSGERVVALSGAGAWLHAGSDHVAFSREFPGPVGLVQESEALRLVFVGFTSAPSIRVSTRQASGGALDHLDALALSPAACPADESSIESRSCWSTAPLRLTPDTLDRAYRAARERSLEAELGGEFRVEVAGQVLGAWRVGAPHGPSFGNLGRLSARLRVRIVRVAKAGMPSIGGDAGAALLLAQRELLAASKLWAQCGVDLLGPTGADIQVVDPPPVQLLAVAATAVCRRAAASSICACKAAPCACRRAPRNRRASSPGAWRAPCAGSV